MPSYISGKRLDVIKVRIEEVNLTATDPRVSVLDPDTNEFVEKPRPIAQGRDLQAYGIITIDLTYSGIKPQVGEIWWCKRTGGRWILDHIVTDELSERGSGGGGDNSTYRPNVPNNLVLGFSVYEKTAELEYTPFVTFDKVTRDEEGNEIQVAYYIVNYRASTSSGVQQGDIREFIWAPNDETIDPTDDPNNFFYVLLPSAIPNPKTTYWQARIRAVRKSNEKGPWSDWTDPLLPTRTSRPSPPYPSNIALEYMAMENTTSIDYGVKVSFDDIGLWDIPGGDYQEDIQSYQVQVMAVKDTTATPPEEIRFVASDGTFYEIVDTPLLRLTVNDSDDRLDEEWQTLGTLTASIDNNTDVISLSITDTTARLPLSIRIGEERMYAYDTDISGNLLVYRQTEVSEEVSGTTTSLGVLKTAITATATSILVTETTSPSSVPFYIEVDDEAMLVTNRAASGTDFRYTVNRAQLSTSASAHDSNEAVSRVTLITIGEAQAHANGSAVQWLKTKKRYEAIFGRVENPTQWYRVARVRTIDRYNRIGFWSPWTDPQILPDVGSIGPFPPAPTDVTTQIIERSSNDPNSLHKVVVRFRDPAPGGWDIPGFDTNDDLREYRVHLEAIVEDPDNGYLNYTVNGVPKKWKYPERPWGVLAANANANMSLTSTTLTLQNAPNLLPNLPFYIRIEDEVLLVESKTNDFTYTVGRARFETQPGVHEQSSDIALILSEPKRAVIGDLDEGDSYTYVAQLFQNMTATTTQMRISEPLNLPATLPFSIKVEDEPMIVTENATASYQITAAAYALSGIQDTIVFTAEGHLLLAGDSVDVSGCGAGYDGTHIVENITDDTFTVFVNAQPAAEATITESSLVSTDEGFIWTVLRGDSDIASAHTVGKIVLAERTTLYTTSFDVDNVYSWTWRAKVMSIDRFGREGLWSAWSQPVRLTQQDYDLLALTDAPVVNFSQFMTKARGKAWLADVSFPEQYITTPDWQDKQNKIESYEVILGTSNGTRFRSISTTTPATITLSEPNLPDTQLPPDTEDITITIGQETMEVRNVSRTLDTTTNSYTSVYTVKARTFGSSNNISIQSVSRSGTTATVTTSNYLTPQYVAAAKVAISDNGLIPDGVYTIGSILDNNRFTISGLASSSIGPSNEEQTVTLTGFSGSDEYALAFGTTVSPPITVANHNASNTTPGSVRYALDYILGRGNWSTNLNSSGTPDATSQAYTVTFQGSLAGVSVGLLSAALQDNVTVGIVRTLAGQGGGGSVGIADIGGIHASGDLVWMRPTQSKKVAGFLDADQNATVNAIFDNDISESFYYRARFRIIDKYGRETGWSPWGPANTPSASPDNVGPPAPINVTVDVEQTTLAVAWQPGKESNELTIPIETVSRASNVVTMTTYTPHEFAVGESIEVSVLPDFSGTFAVTAVPDAYTFRYNQSGTEVETKSAESGRVVSASDPMLPSSDVAYYQVQTSKNDPTFVQEWFGWRNQATMVKHINTYVVGTSTTFNIKKPGNFKKVRKLAADIAADATSITVARVGSNIALPFSPFKSFLIKIGSEKMFVTAVSGTNNNTWTVTRGVLGTTAVAHKANRAVLYADNVYTARVRAVDAVGNTSAWAYSDNTTDAPPQPDPPVVAFDKGSNRNRFRAIVTPSPYPPGEIPVGTVQTAITATSESLSVTETSSSSVPQVPFLIKVGSEIMSVTSRTLSGSIYTYVIDRAQSNTSAASHSVGTSVSVKPDYEDDDINFFAVQLVSATFSDSNQITRRTEREQRRIDGPDPTDEGDERAVFKNLRRDRFVFARIRAVDGQGKKSPWSEWTTGVKPSLAANIDPNLLEPRSVTVSLVNDSKRLQIDWEDPDDLGILTTAVTSTSATSLTITAFSETRTPTVPFNIRLNDEVMKVTAISGTTYTVVRAEQGTTAETHPANTEVTIVDADDSISSWLVRVYRQDGNSSPTVTVEDVGYTDGTDTSLGTLDGAMTSGGTTFTSSTVNISTGIYVRVDNEILKVNSKSVTAGVTTYTVARGQGKTTATAHDAGAAVFSARIRKAITKATFGTGFTRVHKKTYTNSLARYQVPVEDLDKNHWAVVRAQDSALHKSYYGVQSGTDSSPVLPSLRPAKPSAPTGVAAIFFVTEAATTLRYFVGAQWNAAVTTNAPIEKYAIQARAVNASGDPVLTNNDRPILYRKGMDAPDSSSFVIGAIAANMTNSTSVATIPVTESTGVTLPSLPFYVRIDNEIVKVSERSATGSVVNYKMARAQLGTSAAAHNSGAAMTVVDESDTLSVRLGRADNPTEWYWQVRVRARDGQRVWSKWSDWTTPTLPNASGSLPTPPPPVIREMAFETFERNRHLKHRIRVTLTPITYWDIPGGDKADDMSKYVVQMQVNDGSGWRKHGAQVVEDRDDDSNTAVDVIFKRIRRGYSYRARVRSVDRFNRRGPWSNQWVYTGRSGGTVASTEGPGGGTWYPSNDGQSIGASSDRPQWSPGTVITAKQVGPRRLRFDWDDAEDMELSRYKVLVYKSLDPNASSYASNPSVVEPNKWNLVDKVFPPGSHYRYVVPVEDITAQYYFKAIVRIQTIAGVGGDGEGGRVQSDPLDSQYGSDGSIRAVNDDIAGPPPSGNQLEDVRNASMSFNVTNNQQTVNWTAPASLNGYDRTRIETFGSDGTNDQFIDRQVRTSGAANDSESITRDWTNIERNSYPYVRVSVQHLADPNSNKTDGNIWWSVRKPTSEGTPPPSGGTTPVGIARNVTRTWSANSNSLVIGWSNPRVMDGVTQFRVRVQGKTGAQTEWENIDDTVTIPINNGNVITWIVRASDVTKYAFLRAGVQSQPDPTSTQYIAADYANSSEVRIGDGGGGGGGGGGGTTPTLPTVEVLSASASVAGGIKFKVKLTGISGYPNGNATSCDIYLLRSINQGANWQSFPVYDDGTATAGQVHASTQLFLRSGGSGSSQTYDIGTFPYYNGQSAEDQQLYFKAYARAVNNNDGTTTAWAKSPEFTLTTPAKPPGIGAGSGAYINNQGELYFQVVMPPAPDDFRYSGLSTSRGENDVAYYIAWNINNSNANAPTSWPNEVFRRTASSLGPGVSWDGSNYTFRVPSDGRLNQTVSAGQFLWVKVRVRYIGNNGSDNTDGGMLGDYSLYNAPTMLRDQT